MPSIALRKLRGRLLIALCAAALPALGAEPPGPATALRPRLVATRSEEPLVDLRRACPGVIVELRYATARNITGQPIYPAGARALLRASVAARLNRAQEFVQKRGFALKVWDAYRPAAVQRLLWNAVRNPAYVVEPSSTGSLHNWGAAVDVTLVDFRGREARMPTDFDAFSEAARYDYTGRDPEIAFNLSTLKRAMAQAGFRHIRDEWWHYSVGDVPFGPIEVSLVDPGETVEKVEVDARARRAGTESSAPTKKKPGAGRQLFPPRAGATL